MSHEDWEQVKALVADALERAPAERGPFLDSACGSDDELRQRVQSLLDLNTTADGFLETGPTLGAGGDGATLPPPERVGKYQVTRRIAAGGSGTVYEAVQESPHRTVALKLLRADLDRSGSARRFEREAEVLAQLHHPSIAHVYEAGVHGDGLWRTPYIAMELVREARTIIDYGHSESLPIDEQLELFIIVCKAVQHGHERGIVHRDLKPANILVGADGRPKVIDFGIARVLRREGNIELTEHTSAGDIIGTLPYMAPEQCGGDPSLIDERADVYALGVVLFEMLTRRLPLILAGLSIEDAIHAIRRRPPARLNRVAPDLGSDLDAITSMALEKEPERRYHSVAALAADLRRYLDHQPVVARPPSLAYQARLFARRHRVPVLLGSAAVITLVLATVVSAVFGMWAQRAAKAESRQRDLQARVVMHLRDMIAAPDPHALGEDVTVIEMVDQMVTRLDGDADEPPEVEAEVRSAIGATYLRQQRFNQAIVQLEKAIELRRKFAPVSEPIVTDLSRLGMARRFTHDLSGSEQAHLEALAIERERGASEEELVIARTSVTEIYMSQRRFAEAEPLVREILEYRREVQTDPLRTVAALRQLAHVEREMGRADDALPLVEEAWELTQAHVDDSHPLTAAVLAEIGVTHQARGDMEAATESFERGWQMTRAARPAGSFDYNMSSRRYLDALVAQDRSDEAIAMWRTVCQEVAAEHGREYRLTKESIEMLQWLCDKWDRPEDAIIELPDGPPASQPTSRPVDG